MMLIYTNTILMLNHDNTLVTISSHAGGQYFFICRVICQYLFNEANHDTLVNEYSKYTILYKNMIFRVQAQNFLKNPNLRLKKTSCS